MPYPDNNLNLVSEIEEECRDVLEETNRGSLNLKFGAGIDPPIQDNPLQFHLCFAEGVSTNRYETNVFERCRATQGRGQLHQGDRSDEECRIRVPTDTAHVLLQDQRDGPPGTLYSGNAARAGAALAWFSRTYRGLHLTFEPMPVLNQVARRGRGGIAWQQRIGSGRSGRCGDLSPIRIGKGSDAVCSEGEW